MTVSIATPGSSSPTIKSKASSLPPHTDGAEDHAFAALLSARRTSKSEAESTRRAGSPGRHPSSTEAVQETHVRDDEAELDDKTVPPSDIVMQTLDIASQSAAQVERSRALVPGCPVTANPVPQEENPATETSDRVSNEGDGFGAGARSGLRPGVQPDLQPGLQAGVQPGFSRDRVGLIGSGGSTAMRSIAEQNALMRSTGHMLPDQGTPSAGIHNSSNTPNARNARTGPLANASISRSAGEDSTRANPAIGTGPGASIISSPIGSGSITSNPTLPVHVDPAQAAAGAANVAPPLQGMGMSSSQSTNQPGAFIAMHIATPVGHDQWGQALAGQMITLSHGSAGSHLAELRLNPPELGPLRIQIHIADGVAQASFMSAHGAVRQALEAAMPHQHTGN